MAGLAPAERLSRGQDVRGAGAGEARGRGGQDRGAGVRHAGRGVERESDAGGGGSARGGGGAAEGELRGRGEQGGAVEGGGCVELALCVVGAVEGDCGRRGVEVVEEGGVAGEYGEGSVGG